MPDLREPDAPEIGPAGAPLGISRMQAPPGAEGIHAVAGERLSSRRFAPWMKRLLTNQVAQGAAEQPAPK